MTNRELLESIKKSIGENNWKYILDFEKRVEKGETMFTNYEYIDWLVRFTEENNSFSVERYEYKYLNVTEEDNDNLLAFSLFYDGINKYANDNYIFPEVTDYSVSYKIKYNDYGFIIGRRGWQGIIAFCERTDDLENAISFSDIVDNKELPRKKQIDDKLEKVYEKIEEIIDLGIPFDTIIRLLEDNNTKRKSDYTRKKVK